MDAHKNFAVSTVATAPSPATSGTSLVVQTGHGTRFPAVPFNAVVCPLGSLPDPTNAEVVRVTNISTDTFTIVRTQEGSSARTIVVGDLIFAAVTAKTLTDAEAGGWTTITKSIDESVSASTTVQADDELFFTATSGKVFEIEGILIYGSPVGAGTPDLKIAAGEDTTIRGELAFFGPSAGDTASALGLSTNASSTIGLGTAAIDRAVKFVGTHLGNGGTFQIQWAQNTSNANAVTVRAGSILRYRVIN